MVQVIGHSLDQEEMTGTGLGRNHDRRKLVIGIVRREYTIWRGAALPPTAEFREGGQRTRVLVSVTVVARKAGTENCVEISWCRGCLRAGPSV